MKTISAMILLIGMNAHAARHCNPEKSKPCGNSCISLEFECHKPEGTAVSGVPSTTSKAKGVSPVKIRK